MKNKETLELVTNAAKSKIELLKENYLEKCAICHTFFSENMIK